MRELDPTGTARILTLRYDPAGPMHLPGWTAGHSGSRIMVAAADAERALRRSVKNFATGRQGGDASTGTDIGTPPPRVCQAACLAALHSH